MALPPRPSPARTSSPRVSALPLYKMNTAVHTASIRSDCMSRNGALTKHATSHVVSYVIAGAEAPHRATINALPVGAGQRATLLRHQFSQLSNARPSQTSADTTRTAKSTENCAHSKSRKQPREDHARRSSRDNLKDWTHVSADLVNIYVRQDFGHTVPNHRGVTLVKKPFHPLDERGRLARLVVPANQVVHGLCQCPEPVLRLTRHSHAVALCNI
mmetsp:Transcript_113749/g.332200  ORF Transcript_113749/g.332200 Transcript_113749/m.332200 type:complete len:216 (+) Transcript_113749:36-683(+)